MSAAESRPAVPIAPEGWTPEAGPDPVLRASTASLARGYRAWTGHSRSGARRASLPNS
jgi:hypothetical protein